METTTEVRKNRTQDDGQTIEVLHNAGRIHPQIVLLSLDYSGGNFHFFSRTPDLYAFSIEFEVCG